MKAIIDEIIDGPREGFYVEVKWMYGDADSFTTYETKVDEEEMLELQTKYKAGQNHRYDCRSDEYRDWLEDMFIDEYEYDTNCDCPCYIRSLKFYHYNPSMGKYSVRFEQ
jgi:hypothetical protein